MLRHALNFLSCGSLAILVTACSTPPVPVVPDPAPNGSIGQQNPSLRIAVLDNHLMGDLADPAVIAKYARADVLVTEPGLFWNRPSGLAEFELLKAANPNLKILGFFRSKCVRQEWQGYDPAQVPFEYDLYQAARPYLSYTTTGDTLQDWPKVANFDFTDPQLRRAMIDVLASYQNASSAKLDGVYWDYFSEALWISPDVTTMSGDPDMDGDGIDHFSDVDERQSFRDAQEDWIHEMRARLGGDFIQVANGGRALVDSTFASLLDGMNYEIFPNLGFAGNTPYKSALDPGVFNNLWAAQRWLRTDNGGPWQILDNVWIPYMMDQNNTYRPIDLGNVNRAIGLLTGATVVHFDLSGQHLPGIPAVEVNLGAPLGGVSIDGNIISRQFERGQVTVTMGDGTYPLGLSYVIAANLDGTTEVVEELRPGYMYP